VQSACSSIGAIRLRSALGLRAAASVVRARDNAVLLASALHAVSERKPDRCTSLARVRAIPLLPSILAPCGNRYKQPFLVPFARSSVVLGKTMSRRLRNLRRDLQALRKQIYRVIVFMIERAFAVQHSGSELLQGTRVYFVSRSGRKCDGAPTCREERRRSELDVYFAQKCREAVAARM